MTSAPNKARFNMIEQQIRPWDVLDPRCWSCWARQARRLRAPGASALAFVDTQVPLLGGPRRRAAPACSRPRSRRGCCRRWACSATSGARDRRRLRLHGRPAGAPRAEGHHAGVPARAGQRRAREPAARRAHATPRSRSAADGARGLPAEAPFDAIVLSGSVAEVPPALLQQLKVGGRLVAIVGHEPVMRARLFTRTGEAAWAQTDPSTPSRRASRALPSLRASASDAAAVMPKLDASPAQGLDRRGERPAPLLLDVREPWELATASVEADGFRCSPCRWRASRLAWPSSIRASARRLPLPPRRPQRAGRRIPAARATPTSSTSHGGIDAWSAKSTRRSRATEPSALTGPAQDPAARPACPPEESRMSQLPQLLMVARPALLALAATLLTLPGLTAQAQSLQELSRPAAATTPPSRT
jgi:protein-L-isoaspartate(D-aspartate) O-methyltransferase